MTYRPANPQDSLPVAILLIFAAGTLDAYTFVAHHAVFANAMTGNLVTLLVRAMEGDYTKAYSYLVPLIAYAFGVAAAHALRQWPFRRWIPSPSRTSLAIEILFLAGLAIIGDHIGDAAVAGIAFVAAIQGTSFTRIGGFAFTSVSTSANLRHFLEGLLDWTVFSRLRHAPRDSGDTPPDRVVRARRFAGYYGSLFAFFVAGAGIGALVTHAWPEQSLWLPVVCLSTALALCLPWNVRLQHLFREE
ncbi:YoaK family protein [Asticcacaulis solisilvae]|uniref:YoaK family protein n=1 Tax=Asticcacaulis solisilvae TaxID=1217274 RepID=UPI003FD88FA8